MNICNFTGRIAKDLELKTTNGGKQYVRFNLAVSRGKVKEGAQSVDFIPCVAWNKTAEIIVNYMRKGSLIEISGRLEAVPYEANDGSKRTNYDILVNSFGFLEPRKDQEQKAETTPPPLVEDAITADEVDEATLPFSLEGYNS